jgi:3-oxoacyl-[acyl-carrier-protein] synthase III
VSVETFSRYLTPQRPRPYVVMGDAAAAVVLGGGGASGGILASHLRNSAHLRGLMNSPHPGRSGGPGLIEFGATSDELTAGAVQALSSASRSALAAAGLPLEAVDWFIPHQANARIAAELAARLPVAPGRTLSSLQAVGSIGSASIPYTLDGLLRGRPLAGGDRILMASVGAGTAYGAILYQVGA